jgi:membrane-associated phospholipid phosphatase
MIQRLRGIIQPAEWVCIIFILATFLRIGTGSQSLDWSQVRWAGFPKLDLMFVTVAVWTLKMNRQNIPRSIALMSLLTLCFYGFAENNHSLAEPIFPFQRWIRLEHLPWLRQVRWILAGCIAWGLRPQGIRLRTFLEDFRNTLVPSLSTLRPIMPLFVMIYSYPLIPLAIGAGGTPDQDFTLQRLDTWMFGGRDPLVYLQAVITPFSSEWLAFCYSTYGLLFLAVFGCLYLKEDQEPIQDLLWMTTSALALGYFCYTLVPAVGPLFTHHFSVPLDLYYMEDIKAALIDRTRIDRDCFPSLHTAIGLITLVAAWRHIRFLFWLFLPITGWIPLACVYLRYHYVIDVLAGALLAGILILLSSELAFRPKVR